jgi:hypothetical protein
LEKIIIVMTAAARPVSLSNCWLVLAGAGWCWLVLQLKKLGKKQEV